MSISTHPCVHYSICSGCTQSLDDKPLIWEEVLNFLKDYSCPSNLHQGNSIHWRYRAKVAVRGQKGHPVIGLYKNHSHEVSAIPFCLVHHPQINKAIEQVQQWMIAYEIEPYQEPTHAGAIRYLQLVVERETGQVQLSLVINQKKQEGEALKKWHKLIELLQRQNPSLWHSIWINWNDKKTNTIFGLDWTHVDGQELLWESFQGIKVCYHPASFGQANLDLFEQMLRQIKTLIFPQTRLVEFYAGVGVIGLFLTPNCEWIRCSEINPLAFECFEISKQKLHPNLAEKISYFPHATHQALKELKDASTVIVDPPRKGLDSSLFFALQEAKSVQQLIYISCGWIAFKRDCQQLIKQGWLLEFVDGYSFFPGSSHIELLAHFIRK